MTQKTQNHLDVFFKKIQARIWSSIERICNLQYTEKSALQTQIVNTCKIKQDQGMFHRMTKR